MSKGYTNTPPRERHAASKHSKKVAELLELETSEWFCEDVRYHVIGRAIGKANMALRDGLTNEMEVNIDVLCSTMEG